jgi:hypothetical protein
LHFKLQYDACSPDTGYGSLNGSLSGSLNGSLNDTCSPDTEYCPSNTQSISSWFVRMRASGTLTMLRPV